MTIAAIDQGTTSTRALALQPDGTAKVMKAVEHRQIYPQPGWVEHDPAELVGNLLACAEAAGDAEAQRTANHGESALPCATENKKQCPRLHHGDNSYNGRANTNEE